MSTLKIPYRYNQGRCILKFKHGIALTILILTLLPTSRVDPSYNSCSNCPTYGLLFKPLDVF